MTYLLYFTVPLFVVVPSTFNAEKLVDEDSIIIVPLFVRFPGTSTLPAEVIVNVAPFSTSRLSIDLELEIDAVAELLVILK